MNAMEKNRADEIKSLHGQIEGLLKQSLDKALRIGELLVEVKNELPHGQFTAWINRNLPFTERTARNYMELHRNRNIIKTETVSDLTSAYEFLGKIRRAEKSRSLLVADTAEPAVEMPKAIVSGDIEEQIRRLVTTELKRLQSPINPQREYLHREIKKLAKKLEWLRQIEEELVSLADNASECDIPEIIASLEQIREAQPRLEFIKVTGPISKLADRLSKILVDPVCLLGCRNVIVGECVDSPIWRCGVHANCPSWAVWGYEAGPHQTHIGCAENYTEDEPGKCPKCGQEVLKLLVLAETGGMVCRDCYWDLCNEVNDKAKAEIEKEIESLGIDKPGLKERLDAIDKETANSVQRQVQTTVVSVRRTYEDALADDDLTDRERRAIEKSYKKNLSKAQEVGKVLVVEACGLEEL